MSNKKYKVTRKVFYETEIEAKNKEEAEKKFNEWFDFAKFSGEETDIENITNYNPNQTVLRITGKLKEEIDKEVKENLALSSMKGYKEVDRKSASWGAYVYFEKEGQKTPQTSKELNYECSYCNNSFLHLRVGTNKPSCPKCKASGIWIKVKEVA